MIDGSSVLKLQSYLDSLNQKLKERGKKVAKLLYSSRRDGLNSETLWAKCQSHNSTITLISTDFNSVIGCYNPDKWEDTPDKEATYGYSDGKNIVSGKPFLFYCLDDQIEIIEHRDDKIPFMRSDKDLLMIIGGGLEINVDKNKKSAAWADEDYFVHP